MARANVVQIVITKHTREDGTLELRIKAMTKDETVLEVYNASMMDVYWSISRLSSTNQP